MLLPVDIFVKNVKIKYLFIYSSAILLFCARIEILSISMISLFIKLKFDL